MDEFRTLLEQERRKTSDRLAFLTDDLREMDASSRDSNADDEHDPEGSGTAFERSQVRTLLIQASAHLEEVDAALQRLADGSYGSCEMCRGQITPERLEVRPTARLCIDCATSKAR